jgi:drug/metabolite transporter (DMT)-like permease
MNAIPHLHNRVSPLKVTLALALVYLAWGTTYLATQEGVKRVPPCLFGGCRLTLAGLIVLAWLGVRGQLVSLRRRDYFLLWFASLFLFLAGNGLMVVGQKTVPSGIASVLVATTPLWLAFLETIRPHGERLPLRCWLGLLGGLGGVVVLGLGQSAQPQPFSISGSLEILGAAFSFAAGSVLHRHLRLPVPPMQAAGWHLFFGGATLSLVGMGAGEARQMTAESLAGPAILAFFYLLVVGSLIGYSAYAWLLHHVPPTIAGTYAYVNPTIAILVGWLLAGEKLTLSILAGMVIILAGVALVRTAYRPVKLPPEDEQPHTAAERPASPVARPVSFIRK